MFELSNRSISRLAGVNDTLKTIAIEGCNFSPYDYGIPGFGGLRTSEDQYILFKKGVSKCDGYKKMSYHQSGNAFDIYAYVDGKASWNKKYYIAIAKHLTEFAKSQYNVELEWGGNWRNFKDYPHFQIS